MKTKEFIRAVKKLGYYPLENNAIIKITKLQTIPLPLVYYADVSTKHRNALQTDYFPFTELTSEKQAELFDVLIEYARTPLEEREEELRYRLRHKWLELKGSNYLNVHIGKGWNGFGAKDESFNIKTSFTKNEWETQTGRTWEQLMNEFDVEEAE